MADRQQTKKNHFFGFFSLVAIFALLRGCQGQVLSSKEQQDLLAWIGAKTKTELDSKPRAIELYHGVQAASTLSTKPSEFLPVDSLCRAAADLEIGSTEDAFYIVKVLQALKCSKKGVLEKAHALAKAALPGIKSIPNAYYTYGLLAALKSEGVSVSIAPDAIEKYLDLLKDLAHSSGALRAASEVKLPSFAATGMAYSTLAAAKGFGITLKDSVEMSIDDFVASVPKIFALAKSDGGLWSKVDDDHLESTALFLRGTADLDAQGVDSAKVDATAQFLLKFKPIATLHDAWSLVTALKSLVDSSLPTPAIITPVSSIIPVSGQGMLEVKLAWPLGDAPSSCAVVLESALKDKTKTHEETAFAGPKNGVYSVKFVKDKQIGAYSVTVQARGCSGSDSSSSSFLVVVTDAVSVSSTSVTTGTDDYKMKYPEKLGSALTLDHHSQLKVSFKLTSETTKESVTPQQVLVNLKHLERGWVATFVAKAKADVWTATITSAAVDKQLGTLGGMYSLSLVISDKAISNPISWPLADVSVSFQPNSNGGQPPAPPLPFMEANYRPQKEILHVFRPPEKRPPAAVSTAFTALTLAPLLLLLLLLPQAKANLKGFPTSGGGVIAAVFFHGGVLAILLLYTAFWTVLNLMQTIPILLGLGLFTCISGYYALSYHADARLKND